MLENARHAVAEILEAQPTEDEEGMQIHKYG